MSVTIPGKESVIVSINYYPINEYLNPSTRRLAECLGIYYPEKLNFYNIFAQTREEFIIQRLIAEMFRAYSGGAEYLTVDSLVGKVRQFIPDYYFQLDRELKQCAQYCIPMYGDDLSPTAAVLALQNIRRQNNRFQNVFTVVLVIEILARTVRIYEHLRDNFFPLVRILLSYNPGGTAEMMQMYIDDVRYRNGNKALLTGDN